MSEGKRVWEETWTAEIHGNACECSSRVVVVTDREHTIPDEREYFYANDGGRANHMAPRLQLAAAAPDLYRALAAVEWSGTIDGGLTCPTCEATGGGHHEPGCALNAALRKARGET